MPTKKKTVKVKSPKKSKSKNLVLYVEDCSMKGKTFNDVKSMNSFINEFNKKYPNQGRPNYYGDDWIELVITDIKGKITPVDSIEIT